MKADKGITCHAWNADCTQIVVACNSPLLEVYQVKGNSWEKIHVLEEHHQLVSAVDWNHATNRIISCSHDRNVVVWEKSETWKPDLVNFFQKRGVLDAAWSKKGDKFVVGSGSKTIGVGYFQDNLNAWNTRKARLNESSITCVRFDPSGLVVAAGSTDSTCIVMTAFLEDVDSNSAHEGRFAGVNTFGEVLYKIEAGAWVNALAWSPDANWLAVAVHNSKVVFTDFRKDVEKVWESKPFMSMDFVDNQTLICGGFDLTPIKFSKTSSDWDGGSKIEVPEEQKVSEAASSVKQARMMFEKKREREVITTRHKNTILCVRRVNDTHVSSSDILGELHIWSLR